MDYKKKELIFRLRRKINNGTGNTRSFSIMILYFLIKTLKYENIKWRSYKR